MTHPLISFRDVSKSFHDRVVLNQISFDVMPGETFCIIGGSGQGKSITLKLLMGLIPVDDGQIYFADQCLTEMTENEINPLRIRIGMVFQNSALFDSLSVFENVAYPLEQQLQMTDDEISQRVHETLELVGLEDFVDTFPAELSGGMKKRVGVARAIVTHPQVVLYDEPTAGLDPTNVNRIDQLILKLKSQMNITSILVTHNMESVYHVADRVALLNNGKIVFVGSLSEFKSTPHPEVRKFVAGELEM